MRISDWSSDVCSSDLLIRDFVADQGNNILLVGATGETAAGLEVGSGIRACGGNVLADRFPTPKIAAKTTGSMIVDVEGQALRVNAGDTVLVVQKPAWGRGLAGALMRFGTAWPGYYFLHPNRPNALRKFSLMCGKI